MYILLLFFIIFSTFLPIYFFKTIPFQSLFVHFSHKVQKSHRLCRWDFIASSPPDKYPLSILFLEEKSFYDFLIVAVELTPLLFKIFLYDVSLLLGVFIVALELIPLNALLPTFLLVSFLVFMVIVFRFLHP